MKSYDKLIASKKTIQQQIVEVEKSILVNEFKKFRFFVKGLTL
tara:strand:- start:252 stop:380 length:129 start_codon:yes stop_codon:yes gene_type:complete